MCVISGNFLPVAKKLTKSPKTHGRQQNMEQTTTSGMKYIIFFLAGLFIHLVFLYSMFDIYFTSPLVHGMTPHFCHLPPPAKRLVFFVADGLRADSAFELDQDQQTRAPFIRNIVEFEGAWGVSHTHVPTESRPGHVALIAGFYEDVSAVARGWQDNPVPFDSVFNQSRYTWSWGSPDILPMFAKGATGNHVFTHMYDSNVEDFAGANLSKLDTWVFDKVKDFFQEARWNKTLSHNINQDKVVLFLHLLGIDTNGHANRPHSKEYLQNVKVVDDGVQDIVADVEDYFQHDEQTAYIFTSDHGMTNWGTHGAGHPDETMTPFVAWGAGIRKPSQPNNHYFKDGYTLAWRFGRVGRTDMNQGDVAPLMTSLLGLNYPVNNVGVLPTDILATSDQYKAESIWANTQQILASFNMKMEQRRQTTLSFMFKPFQDLQESHQMDVTRRIRSYLRNKEYDDVILLCKETIDLALKGLHYYQTYDRLYLGISVTLGFLGWIAYIVTVIIRDHTNIQRGRIHFTRYDSKLYSFAINVTSIVIAAVVIFLLLIQSLPFTHYIYCLLPVILWNLVLNRSSAIGDFIGYIDEHRRICSSILLFIVYIIGLEIIVLTFFYREVLSIGLGLMSIWPFFGALKSKDWLIGVGWSLSCAIMAIFPMLPVVGRDANYDLVSAASWVSLVIAIVCSRREESGIMLSVRRRHKDYFVFYLTVFQIAMLMLSNYLVQDTAMSIAAKKGLPWINQILSWIILLTSFVIPMMSRTLISTRLFSIALALSPVYFLMSITHEALFCLCLCFLLYFWVKIENKQDRNYYKEMWNMDFTETHHSSTHRMLNLGDLRRAYFFIFFITLAFYGTGNIASINSFEPASVYCFLTVFNPFVMGALFLAKIIIPFILVTCTFQAIHIILQVPIKSLYLIVLIMSDFMGLHFFYLVRDEGSWMDIGVTISHYTIVMVSIVFLMLLMLITKPLTTYSLRKTTNSYRKSHFN